ncbi:MAG: beta strand repeat-containing protein, partial [Thermoanaerobaculia bacterium]
MPLSLTARAACLALFVALTAFPALAVDYAFTVNLGTDEGDASLADGFCDTDPDPGNQMQCTLRAAIMQANNEVPTTLHKITFSVPMVTLTASLPSIIQPTVIDGSGGGPRVQINGNDQGCFSANSDEGDSSGDPFPDAPQANNSRFEHLVIYGCTGLAAIDLSGHGYVVSDSFIGTDAAGSAQAGNPNATIGINISAAQEDGLFPTFPPGLPGELTDIASILAFLAVAATELPPTVITGNVISGNESHGIDIHGKFTSTTIVFDNKIGVDVSGATAIPNGVAGGGAEHGIYVNAGAYMNFIGLDNVIAGHSLDDDGDGINIATGAVPFPNFVLANIIGASPLSATPFVDDFGNGRSGVNVAFARPTNANDVSSDPPYVVNPLGLSAVIGPGNVIGHNGQSDGDACLPTQINCFQGGILVSNGNTIGARIWGNLIGISDPSGLIDIGNHGDGINVVGTQIEIGGATLVEGNLIASNDRHGLVIRGGTSTNNVIARANYIGTTPLGGDVGNDGFGIWLRSSGTQIGGPAFANERNTIAYNGDHAIKADGGGSSYGNLIQHNQITNVTGLPIDLDQANNAPDDTDNDPVIDRLGSAFVYANWQQNTLTLDSTAAGGTSWTLRSSKNRDYRIEFYEGDAPNTALTHLCDINVTASLQDDMEPDPQAGMATGTAGCAATSPGSYIIASVTDITPTSGSEPDRPGFPDDSAINNTSEFSASILAQDEVQFVSAVYNVNENGGSVNVTLQRTGSGVGAVSVDVADLLTGTATSGGADYTFSSPETVNWADADLANKMVTITIVDDSIWEDSETILLQLQNATDATIGAQSQATVNINDTGNDNPPSFAIDDIGVAEGTDPTITFTVTKTGDTALASSVNFAATPGTATQPGDYSGTLSGTLNFAANETTQQVVLDITDDTTFEVTESFTVGLNTAVNATISDNSGIGTIDDDDTPTFMIDDVSENEGNAGTTAFTFTVTMSNATSVPITVDWASADGSATVADNDYAADSDTVTFPALGSLTQPITINVNGDVTPESNEIFSVDLSNASAGTIPDPQGLGTILNDDAAATELNIGDASALEGTDATMTFTVTRSGDTSGVSSVDYGVFDGTAETPGDYTTPDPLSGTLNFAADETTKTVTFTVVNDNVFEPTEFFNVFLNNAAGAMVIDGSGVGTITDDDTPTVSIDNVTQAEGTGGASTFTFTVTLSNPSAQTITVDFATADGSATVGDGDYTASSGTVTFNALDTSESIVVSVGSDATEESDETFFVNLTNLSAGTLMDAEGLGTIENDDAPSSLAIDDPSATEGTDPSITFTVTRTGNTVPAASVDYTVNPGTAGSPDDYTGTLSGTLNFASGDDTETISLALVDDNVFEPTEDLTVVLSNPSNVTISDDTGTGTIDDDDPQPTISIADESQLEGDVSNSMVFTVTLSNPSSEQITVDFATADGSATAGSDYTSNLGTLTFVAGDTSEQITVEILGETDDEADEDFVVDLTNATNATISDAQAVGTITNDDAPTPTFTIDNVTLAEGNAGTTAFTFTVTLDPTSGVPTSVDVMTGDGTATTADGDYAANSQTLNFAAGDSSETFTVMVNGDTKLEGNETFSVTMSNATGGAMIAGAGLGTITNDDPVPSLSIDDVSQFELNAGTSNFTFTVSLSNPSSSAIMVDFATMNGSATTADADYVANSNSLSFAPGVLTQNVVVVVNGDATPEANETFTVVLSSPAGASILDDSGTGTIVDDDGPTSLIVDDPTATEGIDPTIVFTVTRSGNTAPAVTVDYAVTPGTATTPEDYTASDPFNGTLSFAAGETSMTVTMNVVDDGLFELAETLTITLSNAVGATISDASGTGTINDDELQPTISIDDVTQLEGAAGLTAFTFTVTLSNPSAQMTTVDFATADGTATAGSDYATTSGTVTFLPGDTSEQVVVQVNGDVTNEPDETFFVNLSLPSGAAIVDGQGLGTITNDDLAAAPVPANAALGPATLDGYESCDVTVQPAATLLLPYFEVDPTGFGENTVVAITNASDTAIVAHVTVWSNWS